MWTRLPALIRKEMLAILRDPKGRFILIIPPIIQLLLFSFAMTFEVKNASVAVFDVDAGRWSHELIQRINGAPVFGPILFVHDGASLRRAIDEQEVLAAVQIGPSFSRDLEAGRPASLQVILDGRRSNASQIAGGHIAEIATALAAETRPGLHGVELVSRNWFNPNLETTWFTVPNLIAMIALLVGLLVTALSVAREREIGTFEQLIVSPLQTHEILLGKTIPPFIIGMFHITVFIIAAVFIFQVPLHGSLFLLYVSAFFYLAALIAIGLFLSSLSMTQQQAILGAFLFLVPATLLSGFATPIENMPEWLQPLTMANPLRHFLVVVKGIFLRALPAREVAVHTFPLILIAAVSLSAAAWLFRRRME